MSDGEALVFRATASTLAALPAALVIETMRPLSCAPLAGAPGFVVGAAVVRGRPTPIVDVGGLLGSSLGGSSVGRWVMLRVGARVVGLAVMDVIGVRRLSKTLADSATPPLFTAAAHGAVGALSVLDDELLVVLETARLLPDDVWPLLETNGKEGAR